MKGLLIKDLRLLYTQKSGLLLMCGLAVALSFYAELGSLFLVLYVTVFSCMLGLNTIAYDQFDNGYAFLFTLPITRRQYVAEKYIFSLCVPLLFWLCSIVTVCILQRGDTSVTEQFTWGAFGPLSILFITAFSIPIHLKFPSSLASAIVSMGMAGIMLLCLNPDVLDIFSQYLPRLTEPAAYLLLFIPGIALYLLSMCLSIHIIEKRDY